MESRLCGIQRRIVSIVRTMSISPLNPKHKILFNLLH